MTADTWPFSSNYCTSAAFAAFREALTLLPDEVNYREALWSATLTHIAEVPRYAGRLQSNLEDFPFLSGYDVAEAERTHDLYHPAVPRELLFSTGGTSGRAKLMPHAYAQFAAMSLVEEATLETLRRHDDYTPFNGEAFARTRIIDPVHGPRFPWPSGPSVQNLALGCDDRTTIPVLRDLLVGSDRNPVRGRPVRELIAAMSKLIAVAAALEQSGTDLSDSTVERLYAGGSSSSPARRRLFTSVLGGRFIELFGMTEVWQGNCQRCSVCELYHEPLTVIHEYLPVKDFPEPYCELVVTTLVPYALTVPLLRYRTGDLVRLGNDCPVAQKRGFEYVGRIANTRYFGVSGLVLSPIPVAGTLSDLKGIRRLAVNDPLEGFFPLRGDHGLPAYRYQSDHGDKALVQIEVVDNTDLPRTECERRSDELRSDLAQVDSRIPDHLDIEFVPSGTLSSYGYD